MANPRLVRGDDFISFDKNLNILSYDIHKEAVYVYHKSQNYFTKGNPSKEYKEKMKRLSNDS
jgi:hypothetical protein